MPMLIRLITVATACALVVVSSRSASAQTFVNPTLGAGRSAAVTIQPPAPGALQAHAGLSQRQQERVRQLTVQLDSLNNAFAGLAPTDQDRRSSLAQERANVDAALAEASVEAITPQAWNGARQYASANFAEFRDALRLRAENPTYADRLVKVDSAALAAALATIAANPLRATLSLENLDDASLTEVQRDQRALRAAHDEAVKDMGGREIIVFAEGAIRGSLAGDGAEDGGTASAGTGSFGASVQTRSGQWTAKVVLAAVEEAVTGGYGALVLSPTAGRSLASGLLDVRLKPVTVPWTDIHIPLHLYSSIASSRWGFTSPAATDTSFVDATVLGLGALAYHQIVNGTIGDNGLALTAEIGGAIRVVDGNARNSQARIEGFGRNTWFGGIEAGFAVAFGDVLGTVQAYYLLPTDAHRHVDNLTGLNLVAGIGITGAFIRDQLRF